ncbi:MAG: hypothetical protein A2W23_09400 [Planctomycetes bacterium RBG_16_43_13]|nr:MAG: hypothetical protein A2W23_09400 [Planctomycetes bacterium RBG_16_43_13]
MTKFAVEGLISELLPFLDALHKSAETLSNANGAKEAANILDGIKLAEKELMKTLAKNGVKPIEVHPVSPIRDCSNRVRNFSSGTSNTDLDKKSTRGDISNPEGNSFRANGAKGVMFNPLYHEAVAEVETDDHPDKTILEEMRRGYMIQDRVLRPSQVKVAKKRIPKSEALNPKQYQNPNDPKDII